MKDESKRQELAQRLVEREVLCCVSSMVSGLMTVASELPSRVFQDAFGVDTDDLYALSYRPDYEEAAQAFIMDDADLDPLEEIADENGYWSDVLSAAGVPDGFDGVAEYVEAHPESEPRIRALVWALLSSQHDYKEVCEKYDLEPNNSEVYEHWVVTDWLAVKLAAKGEVTGEVAGLTIWGRCTTGQSMTIDSIIQEIAVELFGDTK